MEMECLYVYMHVGMYGWADEHVVHTYGALQIVACFELAEADRFPGSNYRRLCSLSSPTSPAGERAVTPQKHALLPPPPFALLLGTLLLLSLPRLQRTSHQLNFRPENSDREPGLIEASIQ